IARIDHGHPAIRPVVRDQFEVLFRASAPDADVPPVGGRPVVERFLYCHPDRRPWIEAELEPFGPVAPDVLVGQGGGGGPFDLADPDTILLVQFASGLAGLAQWSFRRGGFAARLL